MFTLLLFLTTAGWIALTWRQLQGCQRVRRTPHSLGSWELWRRTCLSPPTPGSFPQPREERILVWRLAGLPVWTSHNIIALPLDLDGQIDHIAATAFDHHFRGRFALGPTPQVSNARNTWLPRGIKLQATLSRGIWRRLRAPCRTERARTVIAP